MFSPSSVSSFACLQYYWTTKQLIFTTFGGIVDHRPRRKPLGFGVVVALGLLGLLVRVGLWLRFGGGRTTHDIFFCPVFV